MLFLYSNFDLDFSICLCFGRSRYLPKPEGTECLSLSMSFLRQHSKLLALIFHGDDFIMAFITSWSEVITLVQAIRITSYMNETVLYFPFSSHSSCTVNSKKTLLPKFIVCFLGTWLPFVLLQIIILLFKVQIPAYIEMNIPWLYFVNSFLIATVYWCKCHTFNLRDIALPVDPFVNWKSCFIALAIHDPEQIEKPTSIIIC